MTTKTMLQQSTFPTTTMETGTGRQRAMSHKEYLDTLQRPSAADMARIEEIQIQREHDISAKYDTKKEHDAAKLIQRAYRGHRERRQLNGLTVDPSSRWDDFIKQWKYLSATAPHLSSSSPAHRDRSDSAANARLNWQRAAAIAEHAAAGEANAQDMTTSPSSINNHHTILKGRARSGTASDQSDSMLMDLRYFLEMVDQKHRYGANLQVYHEEWQRSNVNQNFFFWLDHGAGKHLDLAPVSPRARLEKEQVRYLTKEERRDYLVRVDKDGLLRWEKNGELITTNADLYRDSISGIVAKDSTAPAYNDEEIKRQRSANDDFNNKFGTMGGIFRDTLSTGDDFDDEETSSRSSSVSSLTSAPLSPPTALDRNIAHQSATKDHTPGDPKLDDIEKDKKKHVHVSPATILNHLLRASVRPGTWIYVADTCSRLYVGLKASGAFQHASFLSGARISSAGIIGIKNGRLEYLSPLSGHYRPTTKSFKLFMENLKTQGVNTHHLKVSSAYRVLLGMEYYGTSKKNIKKMFHQQHSEAKRAPKEEGSEAEGQALAQHRGETQTMKGRGRVRQEHEHRNSLAKLMDDLHVRRLSDGEKGKET